ncbi:MAG: diguanylate cyclase [Ruminiclostridium sp.]|nr:diguanylate cyclase [Ruminiclostridium sp.]
MKDNRRDIPIRKLIIMVFMTVMFISITGIGYLVFSRWFSSAKQTTERIAKVTDERINTRIYSFLNMPDNINESSHKIIENEILDISNEQQRNKFFVGVLNTYEEMIYSFSYGTANGEYYGARRNKDGEIEIMKNNAATGGQSWYYSVKDDLTAGELVVQVGQFDPRTRAWFKAAVAAGVPTFSPIYKHFVMDDLTISYACPVYNDDGTLKGVLGTHMLLKEVGNYLEYTVSPYNGYAVILEDGTDELIASSMSINYFSTLEDGTPKRYDISEIQNTDIKEAYEQYKKNPEPNFIYSAKDRDLYINVNKIQMAGLSWVVISAIPDEYLITPAVQSFQLSAILAALLLLLSFIIYTVIIGKLLGPIKNLLQTTYALASGDFSKRVDIVRNDEIGKISKSFNKVADEMQFLVNNLEVTVKERTEELHKANIRLEENKNQLQLILDSTAEAIYGIDLNGNCTFCNISCINMLGYNDQTDLLGKNMHLQIHHTRRDGIPLSIEECKIFKAFSKGEGTQTDDEMFWRSDGTSFDVEYYSYPQIKNNKIVGAVVTFWDISDRKQKEAKIKYLSCHDTLTGLYDRRCFEENRTNLNNPDNLPLSVIFADINGLKMTNDIFGHSAGDELIKKSSEILKQACRQNDFVARIGGDEFIIFMPKTTKGDAEKILNRIKFGFMDARIEAIKCSISLGLDTKISPEHSLDEIVTNAENAMYKDKTMNRKSINKGIIDTIVQTLHTRSPKEKQHSINVSDLCFKLGSALHLPETEINKLKRAGYLHDIGKIVLEESILTKDFFSDEEREKIRQHSVVGYRILNLFDETLDLAEHVYSHHEKWDGTGYPRGLEGEQIPLISRIISVVENYDRMMVRGRVPLEERKQAVLEIIKKGAGTQFDPQIVDKFVQMMI